MSLCCDVSNSLDQINTILLQKAFKLMISIQILFFVTDSYFRFRYINFREKLKKTKRVFEKMVLPLI